MQSTLNESESDAWVRLAPLLEEGLNCLGKMEHDAVVLRFFEGKDLKQVGASLGMREDAARMRVNRGMEKLRKFFARRGVILSAAAMAGAVSANSVQAAPAGLASAITAGALSGTTLTATAAVAATKVIAMTTLQKILVTATVVVLAGAVIHQARKASQLREENNALQQQQAPMAQQIQQFQKQQDESARQLAALRDDNKRVNRNLGELLKLRRQVTQMQRAEAQQSDDPVETTAEAWASRGKRVKQWLNQSPDQGIPELQLLSGRDWLEAVAPMDGWEGGSNDCRFALSVLRTRAKTQLAMKIGTALGDYIFESNGQLPNEIAALKPYMHPQTGITEEMLRRYELLHHGNVNMLTETEPLISENGATHVGQYDALFKIGAFGYSYQKVTALGESGSGGVFANHVDELKKLFSDQ